MGTVLFPHKSELHCESKTFIYLFCVCKGHTIVHSRIVCYLEWYVLKVLFKLRISFLINSYLLEYKNSEKYSLYNLVQKRNVQFLRSKGFLGVFC